MRGAAQAYGLRRGERLLQQSALSFDLATEEIFLPLLNAGTVVLYARERELSAAFLENYLVTRRISVASVPTAYWHAWAAAGEGDAPAGHGLRLLITGGEAPSAAVLQKWRARWPQTAWVNSYGPTETTVITALWQLPADAAVAPLQRLPAGSAIPGLSCLVCADDGSLQPQGAIGELRLGGASVARGYLGDARATALRFVPDPYGEAGSRCYASGGLARYNAAGELEILGRADAQIKLRGFRVGRRNHRAAEIPARRAGCRRAGAQRRGRQQAPGPPAGSAPAWMRKACAPAWPRACRNTCCPITWSRCRCCR